MVVFVALWVSCWFERVRRHPSLVLKLQDCDRPVHQFCNHATKSLSIVEKLCLCVDPEPQLVQDLCSDHKHALSRGEEDPAKHKPQHLLTKVTLPRKSAHQIRGRGCDAPRTHYSSFHLIFHYPNITASEAFAAHANLPLLGLDSQL